MHSNEKVTWHLDGVRCHSQRAGLNKDIVYLQQRILMRGEAASPKQHITDNPSTGRSSILLKKKKKNRYKGRGIN